MMRAKGRGEWTHQRESLLSFNIIFSFSTNNHHTCAPFSKYDWHLSMSYPLSSIFPHSLLQWAITKCLHHGRYQGLDSFVCTLSGIKTKFPEQRPYRILCTFHRLSTVQKSLIHYIQIWMIIVRRCRREWRERIFIQKSVQWKKNQRLQGSEVEITFSFRYISKCKTHTLKSNQSINQHLPLVTKSEQKEIIEYTEQAGVLLFAWEAKPFFLNLLTTYNPSIPHTFGGPDQVKSFWNTKVLLKARSSFLVERESDQTYIELIRKFNLSSVPIAFIYHWIAWQRGWDVQRHGMSGYPESPLWLKFVVYSLATTIANFYLFSQCIWTNVQ